MMKSRADAKKPVFPAFSTGKIKCFSKIGLGQILDITILHRVCKTLWKNIKYSLRNSRKTVFGRKSAVPVIFREFRLQQSVLLTIGPCLMVGIVINVTFLREKTTKDKEIVRWKSTKMAISGIFPAFSARLGHILGVPNTHLCAKNQKKQMMKSRENAKKTSFSGIFPAFSAGKIRFSKIGLSHILNIGILHQCAKSHEKI